jgi:alpha-ketoglutarate-dependent taurine dioxygenase
MPSLSTAHTPTTLLDAQGSGGCVIRNQGNSIEAISDADVWSLLDHHGVALFRDFDIDQQGFRRLTERFTEAFSSYRGGGLRFRAFDRAAIGGDPTTMTVTGHSQGYPIPLHGELYYQGRPPELIWFFCDSPPAVKGQTTLANGASVFRALRPSSQDYLRRRQIVYIRHLADGDWQTTYQTDDPRGAVRFCAEQGVELTHDAETGAIVTRFTCAPLQTDPITGETAFINNILVVQAAEWAFDSGWLAKQLGAESLPRAPFVVRSADGERLPKDLLEDLFATAERCTIDHDWKRGDVLMVDNRRTLHGRRECTGVDRQIVVRMGHRRRAC